MATQSVMQPESAREQRRITATLILLSCASGSMDAIAFFALGQVFTSAMSGNTILLGLALGQGHFGAALHAVASLVGYVVGVAAASSLIGKFTLRNVLGLEALFLAGFVALWIMAGGPAATPVMYELIGLSAIAMGIQGALGRAIGVPGVMTVVFTSTWTAIASSIAERIRAAERPLVTRLTVQRLAALATYLASAVLCGVLTVRQLSVAPWLPFAAVLVLLAGGFLRERDDTSASN